MSQLNECAVSQDAERLREFQLFQLDILKEFARVCELHDLRWWLGFGTLLGAARHQGFIPWDDDIDVVMPSDDYLKFREACEQSLGEDYYFQSHGANPRNFIAWQRIGVKNSTSLPYEYADVHGEWGVCIDVFPAFPNAAPGNPDRDKRIGQINAINRLSAKYQYRHEAPQQESLARKAYYGLMGAMPDAINLRLWNKTLRKLLIPFDTEVYDHVSVCFGEFEVFPAELFSDTVLLPFEDMMCPVPVGYERYLELAYGPDWRELPPVEKRVWHSGGGSDEVLVSLTEPYEKFLK